MTSSEDKLSKSEEPKYEFSLNVIATVFYCGLYRMVGDGMGGQGSSVEGLSFWKYETARSSGFGNATSAV